AVAPVKAAPLIVTGVATAPLVGSKLVMLGGLTMKELELVPLPAEVVTETGPVIAPIGTVAVMCPPSILRKLAGLLLKKVTVSTWSSPGAGMRLFFPIDESAGSRRVQGGRAPAVTVKSVLLMASPALFRTTIFPVVAPCGTFTFMVVSLVMT